MKDQGRFPDDIDKPARTMLTSESSVNRSIHVVKIIKNWKTLITQVEAERINDLMITD